MHRFGEGGEVGLWVCEGFRVRQPGDLPPELHHAAFRVRAGLQLDLTRKRMRASDLGRPFHGVRQHLPGDGLVQRCLAYAPLMPEWQTFSHATAARLWGVPLPGPLEAEALLHVTAVGRGQRPRSAGVAGHVADDPAVRIRTRHGLAVVDPVTAWLQLAPALTLDDLVAAGDHLVLSPRRGTDNDPRPYVSLAELRERVEQFRGRGKRNAADALELIRDGSESRRETKLRLRLVRHGLPQPELNAEIMDEDGVRIGYGDLVYPAMKVLVEYEGEQHRTSSRQFYRDIERHEALHQAGWTLIRESKETPSSGPRSTPVRTELALRSRGWSPPS